MPASDAGHNMLLGYRLRPTVPKAHNFETSVMVCMKGALADRAGVNAAIGCEAAVLHGSLPLVSVGKGQRTLPE